MKVLVGCDPEIFFDKDGVVVSGHTFVPGNKRRPVPLGNSVVQLDGTAAEFNIKPATTAEEFVSAVLTSLNDLDKLARENGLCLSQKATAEYGHEYLSTIPSEHLELGCEPDWDAYKLEVNTKPDVDAPIRTAAGHVHIGFTEGEYPENQAHMETCASLVKELDIALGVPSVLFDNDVKRRSLYGQAGAFRPKTYGLEYRVMSNCWVFSQELINYVYNTVVDTCNNFFSGNLLQDKISEEEVQACINNSDKKTAQEIVNGLGLSLA